MHRATNDPLESLKALYPDLTDDEYEGLDAWYSRYAALIARMYARISSDPGEWARFVALTSPPAAPSME